MTGASRGIGKAVSRELASRGVFVALHYNSNKDGAEEAIKEIGGPPHKAFRADLRQPEDSKRLVDDVVAEYGKIDILINNAAVILRHKFEEVTFDEWRKVWEETLQTNLLGPAHLSYHAAKHMMKQGGGRIVNVSSRGAFRGEPEMPAYGASKGGLNAMSQSLAKALAPHKIFVYTVAPGFVETERIQPILDGPRGESIRNESPLGRIATPAEVAKTISYLALDAAEFLTGCIIDINGASYLRT